MYFKQWSNSTRQSSACLQHFELGSDWDRSHYDHGIPIALVVEFVGMRTSNRQLVCARLIQNQANFIEDDWTFGHQYCHRSLEYLL